ncbi:DUF389 domain-containing protein [Sphingomonas rubra]|uniref:DUF389 domain-containing protein n=1 Tax=Sphingomonas rubra TaxID=634430 RepID=UPI001FE05D86|nr:DUF389 domain-containing protein [Sphingomonas rubra]
MTRIVAESGFTPRYAFMTMMSAGIAILGLLLSSPAVVIGAMLISPLMGPILGLGFSLALFDFAELRRSVVAFGAGSVLAVLFTAAIVTVSPLQAPTAEILARTRPNLFDLLVALFAALAGTFAIIRGRGETIVGVAIATALMPPLAVVGYGLATRNIPVLTGSAALFGANFVTIALAATALARLYGFGHFLSARQSWMQTVVLILAFIGMSIPLAFSLGQIASEALTANQVRSYLSERFGPGSRVTQLDLDFSRTPLSVRSVVIAPRDRAVGGRMLDAELEKRLGRPLLVQVDQILLNPNAGAGAEQEALARANAAAATGDDVSAEVSHVVEVAAGVAPEAVTLDREHRRVTAAAAALPGAPLAAYWTLERRASAAADGWTVELVPPLLPMPAIAFEDNNDRLDEPGRRAVLVSVWAARRWNVRALGVPGLPAGAPPERPTLNQRRALAVAALLRENGVSAVPAQGGGQSFALSPALAGS